MTCGICGIRHDGVSICGSCEAVRQQFPQEPLLASMALMGIRGFRQQGCGCAITVSMREHPTVPNMTGMHFQHEQDCQLLRTAAAGTN